MTTPEQIAALAERMSESALPGPSYWIQRAGFKHAANLLLPHLLDLVGRVKHSSECHRNGYWSPPDEAGIQRWNHSTCTCGLSDLLSAVYALDPSIKQLIEP